MISIRRAGERGHFDHGWLNTYHTFSFADYYDPQYMGFRALRVINEDRVQPGHGFPTHSHRDMEILSYVLEGSLEHKDSLGNGSVMVPGDVQRMTAGTGVTHSEYNHSQSDVVHFLQIWVLPEQRGLPPGYEQRAFSLSEKHAQLRLIGSRDGRAGSVTIHQDIDVYATLLASGQQVVHRLGDGRHAWAQVARGSVTLNGFPLTTSDGAAASAEQAITIVGTSAAEVLVFDLA